MEYVKYGQTRAARIQQIQALQVAVYVAVGGGMIGRMYAEQPADAYIDSRVSRRPYRRADIARMKNRLCELAVECKLDPRHLPVMINLPGCGVF